MESGEGKGKEVTPPSPGEPSKSKVTKVSYTTRGGGKVVIDYKKGKASIRMPKG